MKRARTIGCVYLLLSAWALDARAWDSSSENPEHQVMGSAGFIKACIQHQDLAFCRPTADFQTLKDMVSAAVGAPDTCHSFYFSQSGIDVNVSGTPPTANPPCWIANGVPQNPGPFTDISVDGFAFDTGVNIYFLSTNKEHFGDHVQAHVDLYMALAFKAAARARSHKDSQGAVALDPACRNIALSLAGFAAHYSTDRTATGHGWTPDGHGWALLPSLPVTSPPRSVGMVGCFHGLHQEELYQQLAIAAGSSFNCTDFDLHNIELPTAPDGFGPYVWPGLGDEPRYVVEAHGNQAAPGPPWSSDDHYGAAPPEQVRESVLGATVLFDAVLDALDGDTPSYSFDSTFVSNLAMCKMLRRMCCRNNFPPTCDYCDPDVTDAELNELCPLASVQTDVSATDTGLSHWTAAYNGPAGQWYELLLGTPNGGDWGDNVPRTIAYGGSADNGTIDPDAAWDRDNDIVGRLGCCSMSGGQCDNDGDCCNNDPSGPLTCVNGQCACSAPDGGMCCTNGVDGAAGFCDAGPDATPDGPTDATLSDVNGPPADASGDASTGPEGGAAGDAACTPSGQPCAGAAQCCPASAGNAQQCQATSTTSSQTNCCIPIGGAAAGFFDVCCGAATPQPGGSTPTCSCVGTGQKCVTLADCCTGFCQGNVCVLHVTDQACTKTSDCATGLACNTTAGVCCEPVPENNAATTDNCHQDPDCCYTSGHCENLGATGTQCCSQSGGPCTNGVLDCCVDGPTLSCVNGTCQ